MRKKLFEVSSFFIFPFCVFLFSLFIDHSFNAYVIFPWIDIPMHFLGGFSIAYTSVLFLKFFHKEKLISINNLILFVFVIVSFVMVIAVLWEFWEYLMDFVFGTSFQLGLEDSLFDLFMGMFGGFVGAIIFRKV